MKILNHHLLFNILSYCPLFKGIEVNLLEKNMIKIGFKQLIKNKGEVFIMTGDPCNELIIPVQGSVKAEMVNCSGKTIKIEDIPAPKPLAAAFLFGNQNQFPVNVTALELTEVFILDKKSVLALMLIESKFLNNYFRVNSF